MFDNGERYELFVGDAFDTLAEFDSDSIDLVVTSPPYNVGKEYEVKETIELYLAGC